MRKYEFKWELLGDYDLGRPTLGPLVDLDMYRLMQYTFRDVIESRYGTQAADEIFYESGKMAGKHFYDHYIYPVSSMDEFVSKTQSIMSEKKMGLLKMEEIDLDAGRVILTVDEDLDCSGLPELEYEICVYDEGFLEALFSSLTNQKWMVREIDCWCTGDRTCRFLLNVVDEQ